MPINNYNNFNFKNILNYLLILLPVFLISGPFLSDLSVSILAISSFFFLKNKKFFNNYFFFFFIFFWILIVISSLFSDNKFLSLKVSLFYFRFCLFSLFIWWVLETDKTIIKKIYFVLFFCFFALIFDSIFQYFNSYNILNMKIVMKDRISSFFGDELKMGGFLMRFFPLLVALSFLFYKKNIHNKYLALSILFIVFTYITIFLSGERTSFFMFNFTILLFLIFLNDFKFVRLTLSIIIIFIFTILLSVESPFKKRLINLTIKETQIYDLAKPNYIFSKQYQEHYFSAWLMFKDNKLIGIGPKNFREKCKEKKYNFSKLTCSTHPHNFPLQLLAETGIFGFLIYIFLNIIVWFKLFKNLFSKIIYKDNILSNYQISLLIGIAILIWPIAPNGNIFNNWLSIILFYPVGFFLWSKKDQKI